MSETDDPPVYECIECGHEPLQVRKFVEDNEVQESGWYCPDCEETYEETETLEWGQLDFPVWFSFESYNDNYELLRRFCRCEGIREDIVPDKREFKYCIFEAWFKVTEGGSLQGPYDSKRGERL